MNSSPSPVDGCHVVRGRAAVKLLRVDDEPALRELLGASFEGADVSVDEASSGLEAEERIRRRRPDVIVLDLRMPGMSGTELCQRLKADARTKSIPIVLLTGADPEDARRAQRAGAAALVRKPFSPLDLVAVVQGLTGSSSVTRRPRRMQTHTVVGEQMLGGVAILQGDGLRIVRSHHERWDGKGYPDAMGSSELPIGARVFAVADTLDAMTSDRPYRRAMRWSAAHDEILAQSGKQFDPEVVEAFREREQELPEGRAELAVA